MKLRLTSLGLSIALGSAFAQGPGAYNPVGPGVSLAGNWGPVFHEDAHERGPGPELVNYLGLPITDGARRQIVQTGPPDGRWPPGPERVLERHARHQAGRQHR